MNEQFNRRAMIRRVRAKSSLCYPEVVHRFCGYLAVRENFLPLGTADKLQKALRGPLRRTQSHDSSFVKELVLAVLHCLGGGKGAVNALNQVGATVANANSGTGASPLRLITYADRLYLEAELISAGIVAGKCSDI